jgi:hypothetical protein
VITLGDQELCGLFALWPPLPTIAVSRADAFEVLAHVTYHVQQQGRSSNARSR